MDLCTETGYKKFEKSKHVRTGPVPYAGSVGNWRKNYIRRNTPTSTMADRSINIDTVIDTINGTAILNVKFKNTCLYRS